MRRDEPSNRESKKQRKLSGPGKGKRRRYVIILLILATIGWEGAFGSDPDTGSTDSSITSAYDMPEDSPADASIDASKDSQDDPLSDSSPENSEEDPGGFSLSLVPAYNNEPYVEIHGNVPYFTEEELTDKSYESYSDLDTYGRCGAACASVGKDLMPTEERGEIGAIKPSGWHTVKYNGLIDGNYLYNRCHLIGYQLSGENANEKNLITGTRYLNIEGMLPFENEVENYVQATNNHVLYRVTPIFDGDDLLARGVLMEGQSVEDEGDGICFCVYCYNVQPGVIIDYATGESELDESCTKRSVSEGTTFVLNTRSKKFHKVDCDSVATISDRNYKETKESRQEVIEEGYDPCKACNP